MKVWQLILVSILGLALVISVSQTISLSDQLKREKAYSTKLDKKDKQLFNITSETLDNAADSIVCASTSDVACLNDRAAKMNAAAEKIKGLVKDRNDLKKEYGK